jgi:c-di-GMP-binding flagellar brake protein YcgR
VQDRRKYKRIPMCAQVTCVVDTRTSRGVSRNLSRDGMRLEGVDLKIAESVQLSFRLDAHAMVDAVGTVVWAAERRHGIRFTYMGVQSQRSVRRFIAEHSAR